MEHPQGNYKINNKLRRNKFKESFMIQKSLYSENLTTKLKIKI